MTDPTAPTQASTPIQPPAQPSSQPVPADGSAAATPAAAPTSSAAPAAAPTSSAAPAAPTAAAGPAGRAFAPSLGTRIQVLWRIETDGEEGGSGTVQDQWWGAVVQDCTEQVVGSAAPNHSAERVFILLYEPWGEFEDETSRVAFLPDSTLIDLARVADGDNGILDWRLEGAADDDYDMTLAQVADEHDMLVEQAGISSDADLQALSQMPANVQLHMTEGYRAFADGVKEMLRELVQQKPPGYVVTEADVMDIYAKVKAGRQGGGDVNVRM